ncbi:MAG: DUF1440 domain-containing protein [Candidatus Promineofilum sp.]|nr:DUF1440 domain-containing protein [Promineifilum sp.]MCW5862454.1 hypothetical protein [Anaerolineae bacterium]
MADDASWTAPQKKTIGDVAVDGLLAGMAAGLAMVGVLLAAGLLNGISVTETLGRFDPGSDASPVVGALLHLAVAGLYGVVFAVISRLAGPRFGGSRYGWLLGAAYGLLVWVVAQFVLLPRLGITLADISPAQFIPAHLIYGIVLGYLLGRHQPA